ncbi:hypothetical protein M2444_005390 [Paenibacillus sp. PastF-3]|uniref:hypothetical protein n=1 Tax=Paenibacillus sp. PastF-3 TaxID=2940626 RepID=UPI002474C3AA|nr:hypothetical protein [Paenibacillus sp. PastF-3]MDH6373558.1 hypothetical protein [Paenibacillus sp. PastF-3]
MTRNDLPKFESWLKKKGWTIGFPAGNFVVLRAKKGKEFVTLYAGTNRDDLSWTKIHDGIVNEFLVEEGDNQ